MSDSDISKSNSEFWNELCGSHLAKVLGVVDSSILSLRKFDDWYFDFYPYLFDYIPFKEFRDMDVLEVGLGYGTVAQRLAESGCRYTGLDIAAGPVHMVNHRLLQNSLPGQAVQGSILDPVFDEQSFDAIVAIGCLHHTGDLALAIQRCFRMLRPQGRLIFMVYSAYSYRRWRLATKVTFGYFNREVFGYRGVVGSSGDKDRAAYDASASGAGAPHTDWISKKSLRALCIDFSEFSANYENIDQESPFSASPRVDLLKTRWPRLMGLDLYAVAVK